MLAVHPDFHRKGLATDLTRKALEFARSTSFKHTIVECTGEYSAACARKMNMKPLVTIVYNELDPKLKPEIHKQLVIFEDEGEK